MRAALLAVGGLIGSMVLATGAAHAQTAPARSNVVQLVTGDRVQLTPQGGRLLGPHRHGPAGELRVMRMNGHTYAVPGTAAAYLGRSIDRSVFDVNALAKVEQNGRIPLRISGNYGAVPGFTATGHSGRTATGYLSSPTAFGRALAGQRPGSPLFGGVTDISLDAPGAGPVAHPDYPQVTLIIKVTDRAGKPAEYGDLSLVNVDDATKYDFDVPIVDGEARASVPLGDYAGIAELDDYNVAADSLSSYFLNVTDYPVRTANQTLRLSARNTVPLGIRTPRPASVSSVVVDWARDDATGTGAGAGYSVLFDGNANIYVTPSGRPKVGQLHWMKVWTLGGAPAHGLPYRYDATYEQVDKISANQIDRVTGAQTARVDARFYSDGIRRDSQFFRQPWYSYPYFFFSEYLAEPSPGQEVEYVVGPHNVPWTSSFMPDPDLDDPFSPSMNDGVRQFPAGGTTRADWMRGALWPGISAPAGAEPTFTCFTCRTDKKMAVLLTPVTDSDPAHSASVSVPAHGHGSHFRLYENGKLIGNEFDSWGNVFPVPTGAATYRVIDDVSRTQDGFVGSTSSTVDVTFRSAAGSGARVPRTWDCLSADGACTVLPVLQARIPLPTDLNGVLPIGVSTTAVTVGRAPGATSAKITSMKLQRRFTGEKDWHSVPVIPLAHGQFRAVLANPSTMADHSASLRLIATDATGGKLVETVANAYKVSAS
jgi:hypothetical protein